MQRPRAALKLAAVASSVVLAAGLVSYRAGAFDWVRGPVPAETPPDASPEVAGDQPPVTGSPESGVFLSGSKSGIFIVPATPAPPGGSTPTNPPAPPTLIGGSKSIAPLIPPTAPAPPGAQSPPAQSANPPK